MHNFEGAAAALEQAQECLPCHPAILHELAKAYMVSSADCASVCARVMDRQK